MNIEEAALWFWTEWQMRAGYGVFDGVEEDFHDWCEANRVQPKYRNTIWAEVAIALGVPAPAVRP